VVDAIYADAASSSSFLFFRQPLCPCVPTFVVVVVCLLYNQSIMMVLRCVADCFTFADEAARKIGATAFLLRSFYHSKRSCSINE
jgi:hypothetical protein